MIACLFESGKQLSVNAPLVPATPITMALNWTMLNPDHSLVPLPNERVITTIPAGVELVLDIPDAPPTSSSTAGGSGGGKKMKEKALRLWLTDQRVRPVSFASLLPVP